MAGGLVSWDLEFTGTAIDRLERFIVLRLIFL